MKQPTALSLLLFCLLLLPVDQSTASAITETIQIHGFISQGYLDSSDNNFLADSVNGTWQFHEAGLNLNARITDKLRFGSQLLSRDLGDYGDGRIRLDWGLIDYHHRDWAGLRLGKVKIPLGLYNTERDSDFLRPLIFLPQSIYDETRRDSTLAHWGGELYGTMTSPSVGSLDYRFFAGRMKYDDDSVVHDATLLAANKYLRDNPDPSLPASIDDCDRDNDYLYGFNLLYSPPVDNLRLGLSLLTGKDTNEGDGEKTGNQRTNANAVLSLEYLWRDFTISMEYGENDRSETMFGVTTFDGTHQSWYVMLSYALSERLSATVLYDEYYRNKRDKSPSVHASGRPNPTPWRKDWGFGLRYDVNRQWTVKAEWHVVDGTAMLQDFFNPDGSARYWQYGALKVSFNF
ncbi:MAG: hypothetical protein ACOY4H_03470 [Thermodesulfobacteriota bacterium]